MAEGRYKSSAELYGSQGDSPSFWGVKGYAAEGDHAPTHVYRVYAHTTDQAHDLISVSGLADGLYLGEPRLLSTGGTIPKAPHVEYAGPWPWPGKAA